MKLSLIVLAAFILDTVLGDPLWLWHPIRAIGKLIVRTEKLVRRLFPASPRGETAAGVLLWSIVVGVSFVVPYLVLLLLHRVHPWLAVAAEVFMSYQILARRCLADAGKQVQQALHVSLEQGRKAVGMYVGRDTSALDQTGVIKAAVETIAENTSDGVVAPMLFLLIGGAPLGFLYKAVNTLDSMVGYHNDAYEYLGKCAARMDDVFNFIPARLTAVCMIVSAGMLRYDSRNALRIFRRDRFKHKSPNAGQTESVCAGALHVQLAGDAYYFGKRMQKPTLGDPDRPIGCADIGRAVDLMTMTAVLALAFCVCVRLLLTGPVYW